MDLCEFMKGGVSQVICCRWEIYVTGKEESYVTLRVS